MIEKENTTIVSGAGKKSDIEARIGQIKAQIEELPRTTTGEAARSASPSLQAASRCCASAAQRDRGQRAQGPRGSRPARDPRAVEEGSSRRRRRAAACWRRTARKCVTQNEDQKTGVEIVRKALSARRARSPSNAGEDGSVIVGKILEKDQYSYGFDAQNGEYVNLFPRASSTRPRLFGRPCRTQLRSPGYSSPRKP